MNSFRSSVTAIVLLQALCAIVNSADIKSTRLQVVVPQTLNRAGGYDHKTSLFGFPLNGGSIQESVYYADSELCEPTVDTRKGYPIRAKDKSGNMAPWPSPYILMVDRGGCSFVTKVRNAQRSGATGVLIADNSCLCSDEGCHLDPGDTCQTTEPIMADDGSGGDISIPSFLLSKPGAGLIKAELFANHMVLIEMNWGLPSSAPDDRVEYDFWTTPDDPVSIDLLNRFRPMAQALGDQAYFTPHMYVQDGIKNGCRGTDGRNQCYSLCTNNGRYCTADHGIPGADVVKESLRRICIWRHYGESDGLGSEWWDYLAQFDKLCNTPSNYSNEDCLKNVYNHSAIQGDVIDQCMSESGGVENDTPNTLLDMEIQAQLNHGVTIVPTIFVNGVNPRSMRGGLSAETALTAICKVYPKGTAPEICKECSDSVDLDRCMARLKGNTAVDEIFTMLCSGYLKGTKPKVCKECEGRGNLDKCIAQVKGNTEDTNEEMNEVTTGTTTEEALNKSMDCGETAVCGVLVLESGFGEGVYSGDPVVHGLWPEVESYGTSQCMAPSSSKAPPTKIYPCYDSVSFQTHEWTKHGVCAGVQDSDDFFSQVCSLASEPLTIMDGEKNFDDMQAALAQAGFEIFSVDNYNKQISLSTCLNSSSGKWLLAPVADFDTVCGVNVSTTTGAKTTGVITEVVTGAATEDALSTGTMHAEDGLQWDEASTTQPIATFDCPGGQICTYYNDGCNACTTVTGEDVCTKLHCPCYDDGSCVPKCLDNPECLAVHYDDGLE